MQMWSDTISDRVLPALSSALTAFKIMMAPQMPKEVFIEDLIEDIVKFVKQQLIYVIYPHYSRLCDIRSQYF